MRAREAKTAVDYPWLFRLVCKLDEQNGYVLVNQRDYIGGRTWPERPLAVLTLCEELLQ